MTTIATPVLARCDGFRVEVENADVGMVDEVWLSPDGDAQALAVYTSDGRHGLLRAEDVDVVDEEQQRLAVHPGARLLALEPPRILVEPDGNPHLHASWTTTGAALTLSEPRPAGTLSEYIPRPHLPHRPAREPNSEIRVFAVTVGTLYGVIGFLVVALIALDFVAAWLVTGRAY